MKRSHIAAICLALSLPAAPGFANDPGQVAAQACQRAVASAAKAKYKVSRAQFVGSVRLRQVSNAQTGVTGSGQLDTAGGWKPFSYSCIYNIRSGSADNVSVKSSYHAASGGGSDAGKVVGAVIGTVIAGAIVGAIAGDSGSSGASGDDGWWSPSPGIQCNSYQSACYKNGQFAPKWTHKIYK